jgi:hypothetical protein
MSYLKNSRRNFLKVLTTSSVISATSFPVFARQTGESFESINESDFVTGENQLDQNKNPILYDGPESPLFNTVSIKGNTELSTISKSDVSEKMVDAVTSAPVGQGTAWGIPFNIPNQVIRLYDKPVSLQVSPLKAKWLVYLHTSDSMLQKKNESGFFTSPFKGRGQLNEHVADYIIIYSDGTEERVQIRQRFQIGMYQQMWGENCFESVAHHKPKPMRAHHEQVSAEWHGSQTRSSPVDRGGWINWLWAWENPHPEKTISGFRFEPNKKVSIILSAITAGMVHTNPLRWKQRHKAVLTLPDEFEFNPELDEDGLLSQIQLDMGQVISASPRLSYKKDEWLNGYNNKTPIRSDKDILIEYTAHPEAQFYLFNDKQIPLTDIKKPTEPGIIKRVSPALHKVKIRIVEKGTGKLVDVKLHVHGESDEYLAPMDRHRIINDARNEDSGIDFVNEGVHFSSYISGETQIKLPIGKVYIEVSKGFEVRPIRKIIEVKPNTEEIEIEIEKVLNWREKGWVSADTHVHFLSTGSALLEGSGEGVNVVNLLASQWGELFTNVGDFDGKSTIGSKESGGDGEYLVRVGTEHRQHVLGHISLVGYNGNIITPICTGGPGEGALGDPVEVLLTEWAKQCKMQNGIVILPHFPNPKLENAATIVSGNANAIEMIPYNSLYNGINPYSLADWYRFLNCGYFIPVVGGTDKMDAGVALGTLRTYSKIDDDHEFNYDKWKESIKQGHTFVTSGPLMNFSVEGKPMGSKIEMSSSGGTVDIRWEVASVTVPVTRVELIVNGEVRESEVVSSEKEKGNWRFKAEKSSWVALLVRGHYQDKPEIITAHSSPVMINIENSQMMAAADAMTILEQIEGAMAYIDTIGTKADEKSYKRMRMVLESSHRSLHNRMHQTGQYHSHSPLKNHPGHH